MFKMKIVMSFTLAALLGTSSIALPITQGFAATQGTNTTLISTDMGIVDPDNYQHTLAVTTHITVATLKSYLWTANGQKIALYRPDDPSTPVSDTEFVDDSMQLVVTAPDGKTKSIYQILAAFPMEEFLSNVSGQITDPTGAPLSDIHIDLFPLNAGPYSERIFSTTESDGRYVSTESLSNGIYELSASTPASSGESWMLYQQSFTITDTAPIFMKNFVMTMNPSSKYGTIQGKVTDSNGHAVKARVQIRAKGHNDFEWDGYTNWSNGAYSVGGLPGGTYEITVFDQIHGTMFANAQWGQIGTQDLVVTTGQTKVQNYSVSTSRTMKDTSVKLQAPVQTNPTSGIHVTVNGKTITFDQQPVILNGRTLVPVKQIFDALGANVSWDGSTKTVTAVKDHTTIKLKMYSRFAFLVNQYYVALDVPAVTIGGRTMVPIHFVSDALGAQVDWDGNSKTVIIQTN